MGVIALGLHSLEDGFELIEVCLLTQEGWTQVPEEDLGVVTVELGFDLFDCLEELVGEELALLFVTLVKKEPGAVTEL